MCRQTPLQKYCSSGGIISGSQEAAIWPTVNVSRGRIFIPANTQIAVIKMVPEQLNKVKNIAEKSSCQGMQLTSRINKEYLDSEQATKLANLLKENKMLKDRLDAESKHEKEMLNIKWS